MSLFDLLTIFDWISPSVGMAEEIIGGKTTIAVRDTSTIDELKRSGIRVGRTPYKTGGHWVITVSIDSYDDMQKVKRILGGE